jgi:outer membrane receptor protein involved in Fe transport
MKILFLSIVGSLLINVIQLFAQKPVNGTVYGTITEKKTNNPIEFANVILHSKSDSTKIVGTATDAKGKFRFNNLINGDYTLSYSFLGFEKAITIAFTINEQHHDINLGTLGLSASSQEMKEVTITGKRSTYINSIDRKVFNVGDDLIGKTGSVSELLQNVPSVTVDMEGNISLRGSENVMVLINGKPSALMGANRAAVLQQMPANSIDKIEVITNPSAKYKPDGTSGIINIVLKKNKSLGFNGTIMVNAGNNNRYNGNIIANYNSGKINLYGSYSLRQDSRLRYNASWVKKTDSLNHVSYTDAHSNDNARPFSHIGTVGIDYKLNDHNQIGLSSNYNYRNFTRHESANTLFEDSLFTITKNFDRNRIDPEYEKDLEVSANFRHLFKKEGHELNVDYTTSATKEVEDNHYTNLTWFPATNLSYDNTLIKQNDNESQLLVEYSNPISETNKFESGYIFEYRKNDMNYYGESLNTISNKWEKDYVKSNHFIYTENIHVLYTTYEMELGKLGILAGLRSEITAVKSNQVTTDSLITNNYYRLYPTLHLSYNISESQQLQLNYSHRIRRPEGDEMNPFPEYQSLYYLRIGNPRLKPEDIHSVEFGYQYKKNKTTFISTIYDRYRYNGMTSITKYINDSVLLNTSENLAKSNSLGLEFIVSSIFTKKITVNLSTNAFLSIIDASSLGYSSKKSILSWSANLNTTVSLTKNTMLQVTSNYQSESLTPQGKRLPSYVVNLGLKQEFFKKKASFIITVSDVFNTLRNSYLIDTPELYAKSIRKRSARLIYAGLSYTFGNNGKKQKENTIKFDNQL